MVINMDEMDKLRKELRFNRIISGISSLLIVCLLVCGSWLWHQIKGYAEVVIPLAEQLSEVDYEQLGATVENLEASIAAVDWGRISQQLETVDVEAFNKAIADLDTEELTKALENLNEAVETLKNFGEKLQSFSSKFRF